MGPVPGLNVEIDQREEKAATRHSIAEVSARVVQVPVSHLVLVGTEAGPTIVERNGSA